MSVQLEERVALLEAEKTEHPMLKFAGIFKDDADFAAVVANIAADRSDATEE